VAKDAARSIFLSLAKLALLGCIAGDPPSRYMAIIVIIGYN
jgi:hypothetical protein